MKNENNKADLIGIVDSDLVFAHEVYGEGLYNFTLKVPRLSDVYDFITITISERLLSGFALKAGDQVYITGQFRSYNNFSPSGNRLVLTVFARDIEMADSGNSLNEISLDGFICKPPVYRRTPFGREIADLLLAVNRSYNKSDYIPCIAWGRNARFSESLAVGDNIKLYGRIQSREYQKKISEEESIKKVAYEVSVTRMERAKTIEEGGPEAAGFDDDDDDDFYDTSY